MLNFSLHKSHSLCLSARTYLWWRRRWKSFSPFPSELWLIFFSAPSLCAKWISICSLFAPFPFVVCLTPPCPRQPVFPSANQFPIWEGSIQNPPNPLLECFANDTYLATSMVSFPTKDLLFFFTYRRSGILKLLGHFFFIILRSDGGLENKISCDSGALVSVSVMCLPRATTG